MNITFLMALEFKSSPLFHLCSYLNVFAVSQFLFLLSSVFAAPRENKVKESKVFTAPVDGDGRSVDADGHGSLLLLEELARVS